jgi:hypothetical protein
VKIKKPEDEKYFKDIVLKDILDEISDETGAPKVSESTKRKPRKSKLFSKTLIFIITAILFVFFVLVLFNLVTDATIEPKAIAKLDTNVTIETEDWKMDEDRVASKKTTVAKAIKIKPAIQIKAVKPKPLPRKKTERELAKEALRQQMLN